MNSCELEHLPHHELTLSNTVSLDGRFWIDPAMLGSVKDVINSARISTMALGVESQRDGIDAISQQLKTALIDEAEPLAKAKAKAAEIGVLYGFMLADQSSDTTPHELPEGFMDELARTQEDLGTSDNDSYLQFMRLREIEVAYTGSDVLAFCLASTQDHMAEILRNDYKGLEKLGSSNLTQLQSMYYAGVLSGALARYGDSLPRATIQIMRGMRDPVEQVAIRSEFEPGDNLERAIEYQLSSKYVFGVGRDQKNRALIGVMPGGMQFGPNALSLPLVIPGLIEPAPSSIVQASKLDALLIRRRDHEAGTTTIRITRDVEGFVAEDNSNESDEIAGIIYKNFCVSSYDVGHPHAPAIDGLIRQEMGLELGAVKYTNEKQLHAEMEPRKRMRRANKLILGAAVAGAWAPDIFGKFALPDYEVDWTKGIVTSGLVLGVGGLIRWGHKKLGVYEGEFDRLYQQHLDNITLHNPKNSGNIATCEND